MEAAATAPAPAGAPRFNAKLADQIKRVVLARIESDNLDLPVIPTVALRCIEALKKPDFSFKLVAGILEQDAVLVARLLRQATSASFAAGGKTPTLVEAMTRLGVGAVKTLLIEASAQKVFISRDRKISEAARRLWQHSVAVATIARDVAALTGCPDSEAAYLAGLLHDVGKPIVASILLEAERQIAELRSQPWIESSEWLWVLSQTHRTVGVALTQKWKLPATVSQCIRDCSEFDPADRAAVTNAVCFANGLAKTLGFAPSNEDVEDARALVMIGRSMLGLDDAVIERLAGPLKNRLEALYD